MKWRSRDGTRGLKARGSGTGTGPMFTGTGRDRDRASWDQDGSGTTACGNEREWDWKTSPMQHSRVVICLQRGTHDLHMIQLMPLPPHHSLLH